MNSSAPIRLYLNNPEISDARYLGVSIRSTSGQLVDYMLKNIAINFEFNGEDPTEEGEGQLLQISGGDAVVIDGKTMARLTTCHSQMFKIEIILTGT